MPASSLGDNDNLRVDITASATARPLFGLAILLCLDNKSNSPGTDPPTN
jgi:hypothetical protein